MRLAVQKSRLGCTSIRIIVQSNRRALLPTHSNCRLLTTARYHTTQPNYQTVSQTSNDPHRSINMTVVEHSEVKAQKKALRQSIKQTISQLDELSIIQSSERATKAFLDIVSFDTAHNNHIINGSTNQSVNQQIKIEVACVYLSMKQEFQTIYLIEQLFKRNIRVFVPRLIRNQSTDQSTPVKKSDMVMIEAYSIADIRSFPVDSWGIPEPSINQSNGQPRATLPASPLLDTETKQSINQPSAFSNQSPLLVIVPGVAFTQQGHRLGHGKGYYDRFIAKIKQQSVATAHQSNESTMNQSVVTAALALKEQIVDFVPTSNHDELIDCVVTEDNHWLVKKHPIFAERSVNH